MSRWIIISVACAALVLIFVVSYSTIIGFVGGAFDSDYEPPRQLSPGARSLIDLAFSDVQPEKLRDYHVHVIALDGSGHKAWVNPSMLNWWGLHSKIKADVFLSGSGVSDIDSLNTQYMDRLLSLTEDVPKGASFQLLAFDYFYSVDGIRDREQSEIYVSNRYVFDLVEKHGDVFTAAISIHPYREDAIERLVYWAKKGARFVKWLPNAQGMRPDHPSLDSYYKTLRENGLVLLTHVGEELAVSSSSENQVLGNPLRFRRALDLGVTVLMAHAASAGTNVNDKGDDEDNFDLFIQLMDNPAYRSNLFGDISAVTQFNRLPKPLLRLLERTDLHDRLVNGSDYPLPAINVVISLQVLAYHGFITDEQKTQLREIYRVNPLLFDFVTKRVIRHPETGAGFPASMFMINEAMENRSPPAYEGG